ncbi:EAL domain protein (fragment) [Desulfamplus magnetovallimortis]|uniref:EAL domain protein n=1 Tax=Desulfamplus magnetovallimortis TaxID=1246637 RepID=A0A1W1HJ52_9BACT
MIELAEKRWKSCIEKIEYAFQPIVNIHTGNAFAFEALLRNYREAGFESIDELFDQAWQEDVLHHVDLELRKKALEKFAEYKQGRRIKLFYNLDNRLLCSSDYEPGQTIYALEKFGYCLEDLCFEISEKHDISLTSSSIKTLSNYRSQGFKIAVDDCGTGFSGFQTLYYAEPDYIKIDRFFIQNMENDPKKRLLVATIVNMAHFMGSLVMAEGVETVDELTSCRNIGCDMVQGFFCPEANSEY